MGSLIKQWGLHAYDWRNRHRMDKETGLPLIEVMGGKLLDPIANPPPFTCAALIVFGMGEVSLAGGWEVGDMVARRGVLAPGGTIFFCGGIGTVWKDTKNGLDLIARQVAAGLPEPDENDREARDSLRGFEAAMRTFKSNPAKYNIKFSDGGMHTQGNVHDALLCGLTNFSALGLKENENLPLGVVALPYHVLRSEGTILNEVREMRGEEAADRLVFRPLPAWPTKLGITERNWMEHEIARAFVMVEANVFLLPKPDRAKYAKFVKKDFMTEASLTRQTVRAFDMLKKQDPDAAQKWLKSQKAAVRVRRDLAAFSP